MDLSPARHSHESLSPVLQPTNPQSNADLARLLALSYSDIDDLRKELALSRRRADKAERLAKHLAPPSTGHPAVNGDQHAQQIKQIVDEYEQKLARAEAERDEAEARRREALEGWRQLDEILSTLELHTREARFLSRSYLPAGETQGGNGQYAVGAAQMGPPSNSAARQHSRHMSARATVAFPMALPPHPNPNPTPIHAPPSAPARRPRTPSMDSVYPPSKRSRGLDDQRGRPPISSYSESVIQYVASSAQQQEYSDQIRIRQQQQAMLQRRSGGASVSEARIIDRKYGQPHGGAPHHRAASPGGHSRSGSHSSTSSMDVDEMLIKATTGDEGAGNGTPNGAGRGYLDSPHHNPLHHQHQQQQQLAASGLRRRDRENDDASPRPYSSSNNSNTNNSAYPPQHPSSTSYPSNQSAPVSLRASGTLQVSPQNQAQASHVNHIFAPVVTGAPTKKTKFPNTPVGSVAALSGPGPSIDTPSAAAAQPAAAAATAVPAAVPYPPINADGQRICRQCGIVGRYKDGKCVEKWGPGPMGPGTVCDRCRKKMKRVERRGTLEQQQQQQVAVLQAQQQQYQPRANSHAQLPSSQGSDRSLNRTDTILTHQASHGPQSFTSARNDRDRDDISQHRSTHTSSNTTSSFSKSQRHAPTPPSIASLREQHDDDDDEDQERDPDQLPTSNIGRGGSAAAAASAAAVHGRSDSRNGRVRPGAKASPPSGVTPAKRSGLHGSISPKGGDADEMDADADADAEAEADAEILNAIDAAGEDDDLDGDGDGEGEAENEGDPDAELLEAVDAAEANSNASSHGGDRSWLKSEP